MYSHEVFIPIYQGCFAGTGAIVRLPQCQWSKPDGYGEISQCITTTKHSKAKTVCIFLGIYCRLRGDSYHIDLKVKIQENPEFTLLCHKTCVSTYNSRDHINRSLKRQGACQRSESAPAVRRRRFDLAFDFQKRCFVCGEICLPRDPKNLNRWRTVQQCQTVSHPKHSTLEEYILDVYNKRNDMLAHDVRNRLQIALIFMQLAVNPLRLNVITFGQM